MLGLALALMLGPPELPPIQRPGEPVAWAFEWSAPPECPGRADVIARVRVFLPELDEPPPSPGRADLRVEVGVEVDSDGYAATVRMSGRDGASERRFSAPACAELADAVALVSAVALDPVLTARRMAAASEPAPKLEPEPEPEPELEPPTPAPEPEFDLDLVVSEPDEPSPPRTVELGVGVFGTGGWGPTTAGFGGVGASFAVFRDRWRWQLEAGYAIPRTLSLADGRRGRVQAWSLGTRGCVVPRLGAIELPLCPGVEAGQLFARGVAPTTNASTESQTWAAIVLGPGLRWPFLDRLALTVEVAAVLALVRGSFLIGDQVLTSIAPVGVRGGLGLELRL